MKRLQKQIHKLPGLARLLIVGAATVGTMVFIDHGLWKSIAGFVVFAGGLLIMGARWTKR